jgi:hypothetical protein
MTTYGGSGGRGCRAQKLGHLHLSASVTLGHKTSVSHWIKSSGSSVGIANGYGLDDRGSEFRLSLGSRILTSPRGSGRMWDPRNLQSNGYRGSFPRG